MKKYGWLLVIIYAVSLHAKSFEMPHTKKNEKEYFLNKPIVIIALKVGGNMGFPEFATYLCSDDEKCKEEDSMFDMWQKSVKSNKDDEFLVLENIKGSNTLKRGVVFKAYQSSEAYGATSLSQTYLIFMDKHELSYSYSMCESVKIDSLKVFKGKTEGMDNNQLVGFLMDNKMLPCSKWLD